MASYTLKLTPTLVNLGTEGSLDTSVSGGVSAQRTGYIEVVDSTNLQKRMVWEMNDGTVFNDTFETLTTTSNGSGGFFIV
jgi:hypothetical protein